MAVDFEKLILNIISPLVNHPEEIVVKVLSDDNEQKTIQVLVNKDDLGRVIGRGGRIANAIRTICYAGASKEGIKVHVNIDSF